MNFNIYLDEQLAKEVSSYCKTTHKKRNAVVREALEAYIHQHRSDIWSPEILSFKGMEGIEPFENTRSELSSNKRVDFLGEE